MACGEQRKSIKVPTTKKLRNLVETVEEEAAAGYLKDGEFWLFMDNSTAESCFFKGGSSLKLLHNLVLRLRKAELHFGFFLHMVHVTGMRMIAQGTDGLLRGTFSEGVVAGKDMLAFVDISLSAVERHPPILEFVQSWVGPAVDKGWVLNSEEWFVEGHGIIGGKADAHGIWIPIHAGNSMAYIWSPPPVIADVALEVCLKAIHKCPDAFHIFLVPRLYSPLWLQMFYKLSEFSFHISSGLWYWPLLMHEPLFVGIVLPLLSRKPCPYEERHCWWDWRGSCAGCLTPVKPMEGIFCVNFCESRDGLLACLKTWHAECYTCQGWESSLIAQRKMRRATFGSRRSNELGESIEV
jgi:hypothetical protein